MKKLYVLATALFIGASAQAQLVDFESFTLASETYDNGSGGNGNFQFFNGDIDLYNFYDTGWSSWTGFTISNTTDVTTPGWSNESSAWTGSGNNGSSNYAVYYSYGEINLNTVYGGIDSLKITNTTYTALSMRDGDGWGKQFGSIYNGDSTVIDGTNGEDFYRVWIYGEDASGSNVDSVEVYLADYRFANNAQDYIVDQWLNVDFSGFGFDVAKLSFKIESSDTTGGWINTPTYFAIDDIVVNFPIGLTEQELTNVSVYPTTTIDQLNVKGEEGVIRITSMNGELVLETEHDQFSQIDVSNYTSGIYVIQLVNASSSYTNRFIKQ